MLILRAWTISLCSLVFALPSMGQVVESDPDPARTDQPVTITFYADRGTGGLEGHDGDVYAHTGISTDQNPEEEWKCVKNYWPTEDDFSGNREDTQLTQIDDNVYELTIDDIRAYYQDTSTSCSLGDDEKIQTLNMVFRNADGSKEGKAEGGEDIFVDVNDVSGNDPFLAANLLSPTADPPLYPFMTATDTTVNVTITADTANVDAFSELRLYVDGQQVTSTSTDSLSYALDLNTPNRFQIRAEAEATADGSTLTDEVETSLIRTPDVVEEPRPSGIEDGINYDPNDPSSVTLSLNAPDKKFVYAIGDFSNWEIDSQYFMKKDGDHWWVTLDLSTSQQYDFQYFVDGEIRTFDPLAHKVRSPQDESISSDVYPGLASYPAEETENMVSVIRPGQQQSEFEFSEFQAPEREDLVIYELLLRDFVEESSFDVLADTLDYLDRLGVNAVELMPVANFGGNNSWGYNPNAHLALDKSYGPPEDFKRFVEEAHSRGIAVIMDVVYNHVTDQSPLVQLYGNSDENPFIVNRQEDRGFCDDFFRELDQTSPFIQTYIDRANEYWIDEFNVDGFRFDLAKCVAADFNDPNYSEEIVAGWKEVSDHVWDNVNSDAYMILEFFGSPSVENQLGGYRDDETGSMMTWHNMNRPFSQADMGFVEDGTDPSSDLTASYYGNRGGYDQPSFIAYMESHDEQWLMRRKKAFGNGSGAYTTQDLETALNRQKLVGAFYFTVPGPRMMWQFGELGYGWGEGECLKESDACSSDDPGRTSPKPIRWEYRDPDQSPKRVRLYKAWSALLDLRNEYEVFSSPETQVSMKVGDGDVGRRIVLEHEEMDAVVFGNFDVQRRDVNPQFPSSGTWYDYFTGEVVEIKDDEIGAAIPLAPGEFHVYTSDPVDTPESGLVPYSSVAPPPAPPTNLRAETGTDQISLSWTASTSSDRTGYNLYRGPTADFDTTGRRIARLGPEVTSYSDTPDSEGQVYYYRLVTLDADGEKSSLSESASGVLYPQTISYNASRTFGEGSRPEDYRLVALPGQVDRPLAQTLSGAAGDTWQAYWDDGTDSDFFVQFDESTTFDFQTGRGFWLISDSTWTAEGEVATVSLDQGNVTTIDLHAGWNIISNPFDRALNWNEVRQIPGEDPLQPLWAFDGGFSETSEFASARTGEAYYFLNDRGLDELTIPYNATGDARSTEKASSQSVAALIALDVGQEGRWASTLQIGWHQRAEEGLDAYDWVAPPNRFSSLSLRARSPSVSDHREQLLARTVQPEADRGQSFSLTLQSESNDAVSLRARELDAIEAPQVRLVDEKTGRSYDLHRESTVQIRSPSGSSDLTLLVGTGSYVQEKVNELTTTDLQLRRSGPNPFREKTRLTYTLPSQGDVKLEVFDVLGRRVRVLVEESRDTGTYHATWDGANDVGRRVASGVYLGRLSFKGKTLTQKLVVVK